MNDQSPTNEPFDRHEARRQRREARRAALGAPSSGSTWIIGLILIVLGIAFLMQNMGTFPFLLRNWWALFILIPAIGSFDRSFRAYKHANNQLTAFARNSLFVGLILTMVAGMFLLNLNWSIFGPILIILVGLGILTNYFIQRGNSGFGEGFNNKVKILKRRCYGIFRQRRQTFIPAFLSRLERLSLICRHHYLCLNHGNSQ